MIAQSIGAPTVEAIFALFVEALKRFSLKRFSSSCYDDVSGEKPKFLQKLEFSLVMYTHKLHIIHKSLHDIQSKRSHRAFSRVSINPTRFQ